MSGLATPLVVALLALSGARGIAQEPAERTRIDPIPADAILVRVVDPSGRPIPDAEVALRPLDDAERRLIARKWFSPEASPTLSGRWPRKGLRTGADGTVLVEGLGEEDGSWRVAAGVHAQWAYHLSEEPIERGREVVLPLTPLPADRLLAGVVLQPDGTPKSRAIVTFVRDDRGRMKSGFVLTDQDGRFCVVADESERGGALHARVNDGSLRSTAIESVRVGSVGLELRLGEPRLLTVDVRDLNGCTVQWGTARFYWKLAGFAVEAQRDMRRTRGEPLGWEVPDVPFWVSVQAPEHESTRVGPIDPSSVESELVVYLRSFPRLRGRVTHEGRAVPGARVRLRTQRASTKDVAVDAQGRFDIAVEKPMRCEVVAWHDELGEGSVGPIDLDPLNLPGELHVRITRAPGAVAGKVLLPPGHSPWGIFLWSSDESAETRLAPDGSYRLSGLAPGPLTIYLRSGPRFLSDCMFGGGERAPSWLTVEPAFEVEVRPGETTELDIDLIRPAPCRLEGRILVDGLPPAQRWPGPVFPVASRPRVSLDRGVMGDYVSCTDLAPDGSFAVVAPEPGAYCLSIDIITPDGESCRLTDRVLMSTGTVGWLQDFATGSVRLLPTEEDGKVFAPEGSFLWRGPGDLRVLTDRGDEEPSRARFYGVVPAGQVQLVRDRNGERTFLFETEVTTGELTTVPGG